MQLINSIKSEWLKTRKSAASWLCLIGGLFIPLIFLIGFLYNGETLSTYGEVENVWTAHFFQVWQSMVVFLLPMGLILATSLITQMEFRNNTWKQLHTTPQPYYVIFWAKFIVIIGMTLQFFFYFNLGFLLSGIIPSLVVDKQLPDATFPYSQFFTSNWKIFVTCLPVLALQFLISLRFKNFFGSNRCRIDVISCHINTGRQLGACVFKSVQLQSPNHDGHTRNYERY
ncbi:MAG: ABC transporter permease [Bacteroidetes bacterium]|nr:ABC transporter permease [Bacteroidota bacterium]